VGFGFWLFFNDAFDYLFERYKVGQLYQNAEVKIGRGEYFHSTAMPLLWVIPKHQEIYSKFLYSSNLGTVNPPCCGNRSIVFDCF